MMNRNNAEEEGSIKKNKPFIRARAKASGTLHLSYTQRKGRRTGRRLQKQIIPILLKCLIGEITYQKLDIHEIMKHIIIICIIILFTRIDDKNS